VKAAFIYSHEMTLYDLGPDHPLRPERLRLTFDLTSAYELLDRNSQLIAPSPATREDIETVHHPAYIDAVKALSEGKPVANPASFGFGLTDNPPFRGMYEASLLYTGGSVAAAELVMRGEAERAFSISGGLHHAMPARASGFCIFNDPAIAIQRLRSKYSRIAYIDIDAHHADGVQAAFYGSNDVLTISIHETGDHLFPGTGYIHEIGEGEGVGYSVNIPLSPSTPDEVHVWSFDQIVPPLIDTFDPQVIVAQLGADAHYQDQLAHLCVTSEGYAAVVERIIGFGRPVVALGGGGYNVLTVARLWTLAYGLMLGRELPDEIPASFAETHGIQHLRDHTRPELSSYQDRFVRSSAEQTVQRLKELLFPHHGLPAE